ncbi:MAG: glycine cleavage system protein H, partial [Planctomycetota bacterium]
MTPEELLFAETHEWAQIAESGGEKIATIGISANAVEALTDLVYMDLPDAGADVTVGGSFGEVESVKATSELYSPVAGEVIEVNTSLPDNLEILNSDPY